MRCSGSFSLQRRRQKGPQDMLMPAGLNIRIGQTRTFCQVLPKREQRCMNSCFWNYTKPGTAKAVPVGLFTCAIIQSARNPQACSAPLLFEVLFPCYQKSFLLYHKAGRMSRPSLRYCPNPGHTCSFTARPAFGPQTAGGWTCPGIPAFHKGRSDSADTAHSSAGPSGRFSPAKAR